MAGWDLSEGICDKDFVSEDDFWEIINNILSSKTNKTTSSKFAFFKALIEYILGSIIKR